MQPASQGGTAKRYKCLLCRYQKLGYLPVVLFSEKNNAVDVIKTPQIKTFLNIRAEDEPDDLIKPLRKKYNDLLQNLSDSEIKQAIEMIRGIKIEGTDKNKWKIIEGEDRWTSFRRMEFSVVRIS